MQTAPPGLLAGLYAKVRHAYDPRQLLQQPTPQAFLASADFVDLLAEARAGDARLPGACVPWFSDARRRESALNGQSCLRHLSGDVP